MIETLISSKTRIKLLLKFFLNAGTEAYLRGLAEEFGESSNAIRVELNRFEEAGMISGEVQGNKKIFKANEKHPLFGDIQSILLKYVGIDQIIERILSKMGHLKEVYLTGSFASGRDENIIDLLIVGDINTVYLAELTARAQEHLTRKIRYVVYSEEEFAALPDEARLLVYRREVD